VLAAAERSMSLIKLPGSVIARLLLSV